MENKLALLKVHGIVASMNEGLPKSEENINETSKAPEIAVEKEFNREALHEKKKMSYAEAKQEITKLIEVVPEAEELLFRERPCKTTEEKAVAQYQILLEGLEGLAKEFAYKKEYHTEKAVRAYIAKTEAEKRLVEIYCDNKGYDDSFDQALLEDLPFMEQVIDEIEVADDYHKDTGLKEAA